MRNGSAPTSNSSMNSGIHSAWVRVSMRSRIRASSSSTSATVAMPSGACAVPGLLEKSGQPERAHPVAEVVILAGAHLDVAAVGAFGGEETHHDAAMQGRRGTRHTGPIGPAAREVLAHQERGFGLQQTRRHRPPAAGRLTLMKGSQNPVHRKHRRAVGRRRGGRIERRRTILIRVRPRSTHPAPPCARRQPPGRRHRRRS